MASESRLFALPPLVAPAAALKSVLRPVISILVQAECFSQILSSGQFSLEVRFSTLISYALFGFLSWPQVCFYAEPVVAPGLSSHIRHSSSILEFCCSCIYSAILVLFSYFWQSKVFLRKRIWRSDTYFPWASEAWFDHIWLKSIRYDFGPDFTPNYHYRPNSNFSCEVVFPYENWK